MFALIILHLRDDLYLMWSFGLYFTLRSGDSD